MSCPRYRQLLHDRYDEMLSQDGAGSLDAHWVACPDCRAYQAEMNAILGGLDELKSLSTLDLAESAARRDRSWFLPRPLMRIPGPAAAVALLVVGGWLIKPWATQMGDSTIPVVVGPETPELAFTPTVTLSEATAERFIPVMYATDDPHVHLVWLHPVSRRAEVPEPTAPNSTMKKGEPGQLRAWGRRPSELARGPVGRRTSDSPVA